RDPAGGAHVMSSAGGAPAAGGGGGPRAAGGGRPRPPTHRALPPGAGAGGGVAFRGGQAELLPLGPEVFDGAAVAFFSAGGGVSREWAPVAAARGAVVVDNSSAWRMHPEVPLVDADVNLEAAADHPRGTVATPNSTTPTH